MDKKIDIIFICNSINQYNGWSVFSRGILNSLPKKYNTYLFTSERPKILSLKHNSLITEKYYSKIGFLASMIDAAKIFINTYGIKVKIIHSSVEWYSVVCYFLSIIKKAPFTISVAGTYGVYLPKKYLFFRISFLKSDQIIALSKYTKNKIINQIKNLNNISVINPGIDSKIFKKKNIKKDNKIIFVGNFKLRKGFIFLLDSLILLKKKDLKFELIIVTNEKLKDQFKDILEVNDISYKIFSNISDEELCNLYNSSKVNVLLSNEENDNFEGFGLIHYESIASGTLTIGALNSGNEDAISEENGYLVNFNDTQKISDIIFSILTNKYPKLNQNKIRKWSDVGEDYDKLFKGIIT